MTDFPLWNSGVAKWDKIHVICRIWPYDQGILILSTAFTGASWMQNTP